MSFPIPLRFLLAAHPQLLSPVLQVTHRAISNEWLKINSAGDVVLQLKSPNRDGITTHRDVNAQCQQLSEPLNLVIALDKQRSDIQAAL